MNRQRTFGLAKLVEAALSRPPHNPQVRQQHVADEYAEIAARAGDKSGQYENRTIAEELRRRLRCFDTH